MNFFVDLHLAPILEPAIGTTFVAHLVLLEPPHRADEGARVPYGPRLLAATLVELTNALLAAPSEARLCAAIGARLVLRNPPRFALDIAKVVNLSSQGLAEEGQRHNGDHRADEHFHVHSFYIADLSYWPRCERESAIVFKRSFSFFHDCEALSRLRDNHSTSIIIYGGAPSKRQPGWKASCQNNRAAQVPS